MELGYRQILERIKQEAPRVRVHVQSVLPCSDRYAKHNANVLDFNERLKKLAAEFGYDYLDLHAPHGRRPGRIESRVHRRWPSPQPSRLRTLEGSSRTRDGLGEGECSGASLGFFRISTQLTRSVSAAYRSIHSP